jgi:outer membrane immunogenic protein
MKYRFMAGVAVTAIMAGSAFAADMPLKAAAAPVSVYDWSGMYLGGVIGGAWGTNDISDPGLGVLGTLVGVPVIQTTSPSAFIGGIEGGSRYQFQRLVVGWEADITWGDLNATSTSGFGAPLLPSGILSRSITTDTNWTATAVSTVGIAHGNWLLYGKAGVAWANVNYTDNWAIAGIPLFSGTGSDNRVGWTVGTGVEWAVWNNWSVKAEYDYMDFGTRTVAINGSVPLLGGIGLSPGIQDNNHINQVKVGVNWHILPNFW